MSHVNPAMLHAIAGQLLAELQRYEHELDALIEKRWDPDGYDRLSQCADDVRLCAHACGRALSMPFTEFLITRAELCHALWSVRSPSRLGTRVLALHAEHKAALSGLRRLAQRLVAQMPGTRSGEGAASAWEALQSKRH